MKHKKFRLTGVRLNGVRVDVRYGDLLVAKSTSSEQLDWEVVLSTTDLLRLASAPYDVHMETPGDRELFGPGLLVRSDGQSHVLRGGGPLDGFHESDFGE